jgi:Xaa-Pro aminopeptidase
VRPLFDSEKLDRLLDEAGVDVVLATSAHNVRYLLGGYRFFFFEHLNAIGVSGYLPCVGYVPGRPGDAFYVGNPMEARLLELEPVWVERLDTCSWTTVRTAEAAADALQRLGLDRSRIAIERSFVPDDARAVLEQELPGSTFVEARPLLAELRAIKRPDELALLRTVADEIVGAMTDVVGSAEPGVTTRALAERLRLEETRRGLVHEYGLIAAGPSTLRAPTDTPWLPGRILSLDSGASLRGYVGDLARMGCMGEPTDRMEELLAAVDAVQRAARAEARPGRTGNDVYAAALAARDESPHGGTIEFVAHGMGLVSHEVPYLSETSVPYPAVDRDRPLEPGMVLSVETELADEEVGFVKLEDTVAVTDTEPEPFGDGGRGWNIASAS